MFRSDEISNDTHWFLCPRGCPRPSRLFRYPGWTFSLTFLEQHGGKGDEKKAKMSNNMWTGFLYLKPFLMDLTCVSGWQLRLPFAQIIIIIIIIINVSARVQIETSHLIVCVWSWYSCRRDWTCHTHTHTHTVVTSYEPILQPNASW